MNFEKELKIIQKGVEEIVPKEDLLKKLAKSQKNGTPLRIKYGIDPTGYDVHIGHLVPIRKMREFQDMGHQGVIIIGDFTAQIGDPTGRDESRPPLTAEQVKSNAERYMDQLYTVLDPDRTEVRWQSEWFGSMGMAAVLQLLSKFTLAQFLAHDTFRRRYENGLPLAMHEIMYPVLQAYDSVAIKADIELGATEQKFNILAGRDMQRYFNMEEQVAILSPLLMGTDGKQKMSKSLNNYIAIFDDPKDKFGKIMSIPDDLILNYFNYATTLSPEEIETIAAELQAPNVNPMIFKKRLGREVVALYHGAEAAQQAQEAFESVFSEKKLPDDMPEFHFPNEPIWIVKLLSDCELVQSSSEARRMVKQGAVSINGEKVESMDLEVPITEELVIKVGKRRFAKVVPQS